MTTRLRRLTPSPIHEVDYQETSFSIDAVARNICNTWEEAMTNPAFDAVVIGSGMFGGYCAEKLFRNTKAKRTLLLEAGAFFLPEHYQDLPDIGLNVPEPMDPANDNGLPRELVWGMPWRGNTSFVGTPYCVGGKSVFWGGWCPRLTDGDLAAWPPAVAQYLKENYAELEKQLGVSESTDFIQGPLYEAMLAKANAVRPRVPRLTAVEAPPLAVSGRGPASGLFSFNKYSSLPLLISAIRDAIEEAGGDDGRRRLFLVPRAHVVKLHTSGGLVRRIEVFANEEQRFLDIAPHCAVVLALGAIESTRIALESFPTMPNPADEKMGRNLTVHMRSTTTVQLRRSALETPGRPLREKLQTAALLVRGETGEGHFHLQVTAADDREGDSDRLLFRMIPDIDLLEQILDAQSADFVAVTFRGCAETRGVKDRPVHNPALRWISLSPFERDQFGFRRAFVNLAISTAEARLWNAMDAATVDLARKLANDDSRAIRIISSSRDGLGTTYHESGTLWMGDNPATSVTDNNGRFHHVANAYCIDQALFPTVGSVNPALTGLTLTRKIAEHIATLK
ncbi:MAG: GMC oxidoreductase [Chthoniobacterales bacterium]